MRIMSLFVILKNLFMLKMRFLARVGAHHVMAEDLAPEVVSCDSGSGTGSASVNSPVMLKYSLHNKDKPGLLHAVVHFGLGEFLVSNCSKKITVI
jgi:hypothetical protein